MGTHYTGRPVELRALDAFIKLTRAVASVNARLGRRLAKTGPGLTPTQLGVLEALLHLGPLSQKTLCAKLLTSGSNVTTVIDNLERRRLVRRERGVTDRRQVTVALTPSGRRLIGALFPGHVAAIVEEFSVLTAAEQEALGRLAKRLGRRGVGGATARTSRPDDRAFPVH